MELAEGTCWRSSVVCSCSNFLGEDMEPRPDAPVTFEVGVMFAVSWQQHLRSTITMVLFGQGSPIMWFGCYLVKCEQKHVVWFFPVFLGS